MAARQTGINLRNSQVRQQHTCPATKIKYWGECPNLNCPANISRHGDGVGGCFLQVGQPNVTDVGRYLHLTTREVRRAYERGFARMQAFLEFYQWLQSQREVPDNKPHCQKCGVPLSSGPTCANPTRCQRRQRVLIRARQRYPLRLAPLKISDAEFWAIVAAQKQGKINVLSERLMQRGERAMLRLLPTNQISQTG